MSAWKLAPLDDRQLRLVHEAEQSLHLDFLLVYREAADGVDFSDLHVEEALRPAQLSDSEIECLQGVERKLGAVAVAYQQAHS